MAPTDPRPSAVSATAPGPDLESLEQEREFLLRSLADLDAELEAGDIEEDDYRFLTDDYTARTATVLRAIEAATGPGRRAGTGTIAGAWSRAGRPSTVPAGRLRPQPQRGPAADRGAQDPAPGVLPTRRRWRTSLVIGAVVVFGGITAWAIASSSGARQAQQTITGNSQIGTTTAPAGGVDPRLTEAVTDINKGDVEGALQLYRAILQEDPNQPVALANSGWLEAEAGVSAKRTDLINAGLAQIVQAEKIAPTYPDEHYFRGYLLLEVEHDAPGAVTEFRSFLGLADPTGPEIPSIRQLLQQAIQQSGAAVPPGPNAAPATTTPSSTSKP
jgi:tetratricopeptide (TPR) repeat protein